MPGVWSSAGQSSVSSLQTIKGLPGSVPKFDLQATATVFGPFQLTLICAPCKFGLMGLCEFTSECATEHICEIMWFKRLLLWIVPYSLKATGNYAFDIFFTYISIAILYILSTWHVHANILLPLGCLALAEVHRTRSRRHTGAHDTATSLQQFNRLKCILHSACTVCDWMILSVHACQMYIVSFLIFHSNEHCILYFSMLLPTPLGSDYYFFFGLGPFWEIHLSTIVCTGLHLFQVRRSCRSWWMSGLPAKATGRSPGCWSACAHERARACTGPGCGWQEHRWHRSMGTRKWLMRYATANWQTKKQRQPRQNHIRTRPTRRHEGQWFGECEDKLTRLTKFRIVMEYHWVIISFWM